jgi:hypothetical protein
MVGSCEHCDEVSVYYKMFGIYRVTKEALASQGRHSSMKSVKRKRRISTMAPLFIFLLLFFTPSLLLSPLSLLFHMALQTTLTKTRPQTEQTRANLHEKK